MKTASSITELIGSTPLLELRNIATSISAVAKIYGKIESFNPCSSIKDRVALSMINDAIEQGKINSNTTIIEPTSGNTGIGLAMVAASKGLKLILTMPDTMSKERRALLKFLGAELVLTTSGGMSGAIQKANELHQSIENSIILDQFSNPSNPNTHFYTTAVEIINQLPEIDILVAGVGTGGSLSGIGKALKAHNPNITIVAVEPSDSAVISGSAAAPHKLQGIGAGFIPDNLNTKIIDTIITVTSADAFAASQQAARKEGLLIGISSGAALHAASLLSVKAENRDKHIVVILPDSAERYLSTELFADL